MEQHRQEVARFSELVDSLHRCVISLMLMLANTGENNYLGVAAAVTGEDLPQLLDIVTGFRGVALATQEIINDAETRARWLEWSPDQRMEFCTRLLYRNPDSEEEVDALM